MIDNSTNSLEEYLLSAELTKLDRDFAVMSIGQKAEKTGLIVYSNVPTQFYTAVNSIQDQYKIAVRKHPEFPSDTADALCIILEEYAELNAEMLSLVQSHNDGDTIKFKTELAHTIVTAIRLYERLL